jgi:dTDP-4-dehydrorhamnose reductase
MQPTASRVGMEVWGGLECTVNRVGEQYFSQLDRDGYATGLDDLARFSALGIRTLRFPVLWERIAPRGLRAADWSWTDCRLARLRELRIAPIAGLLHHGSGPRDTSLVDPAFPEKLAAYAAAVAARYPWVDQYTPVNEPLTTARFSGLYGHWYPHGRDPATFRQALFNQCRGVVLAMRAIREVNADARLVQTDDLGTTHSTAALAYQADFNNQLRWLAWDLLCGRVDREHALWSWLTRCCGASAADILWFKHNPSAPDIVGVNHYVTSDRFLDENADRYPPVHHGGNGRHRYADIEAVRTLAEPGEGVAPLLAQAWARYGLPLAITEAHLDASREDQLRWLAEIWSGAERARRDGADVRAVTVWGLLGSYDWNSLLTECRGYYESGAFDVRSGRPRPTAIAKLIPQLAAGGPPQHPVLAGAGWWRRPGRHCTQPVKSPTHLVGASGRAGSDSDLDAKGAADIELQRGFEVVRDRAGGRSFRPPILIVGATGTLGCAFARICAERDLEHRLLSRSDVDIADADAVDEAIDHHQPWAVINAAGYVRVDDAECDAERCFRDNALGAATLASSCARHGIGLVTFSTDLVFDGRQQAPYLETDPIAPLNVYGRSKARAEALVLDRHPGALVVRTSAFFGPWDSCNFVTSALRALRQAQPFAAAHDMTVSPTYVPDLVQACLDLLIDGECGLWHLSNGDSLTWADFALRAARMAGIDAGTLRSCPGNAMGHAARRPRYSALGSDRAVMMPPLDDALGRYLSQARVQ